MTENNSRVHLNFFRGPNNRQESITCLFQNFSFFKKKKKTSSIQLKSHIGVLTSSRMLLRAHLWRAAAGEAKCRRRRSDGSGRLADPRDPAVTLPQLPFCSSLWNLLHLAAQTPTNCAPKFTVQLWNCHMAAGLGGRTGAVW